MCEGVDWAELLQGRAQLQFFKYHIEPAGYMQRDNFKKSELLIFQARLVPCIYLCCLAQSIRNCHFEINTSTKQMGRNLAVACFSCGSVYYLTFSEHEVNVKQCK
jgi:hypothetical protein